LSSSRRTLLAECVWCTCPDSQATGAHRDHHQRGRNRQSAACSTARGTVIELRRTRIGPITDRRIKPGQVRELTTDEIKALFSERK
jgi:hypothetical protein